MLDRRAFKVQSVIQGQQVQQVLLLLLLAHKAFKDQQVQQVPTQQSQGRKVLLA